MRCQESDLRVAILPLWLLTAVARPACPMWLLCPSAVSHIERRSINMHASLSRAVHAAPNARGTRRCKCPHAYWLGAVQSAQGSKAPVGL